MGRPAKGRTSAILTHMKSIIQAMIEEIYEKAQIVSDLHSQVVGERNDKYITLEQLELILKLYND